MTSKQFRWTLAVAAVAVVGLPTLGNWYRRQRQPRCALDGAAIEPIYAVEIVGKPQGVQRFCCIRCAEYWLARQANDGQEVLVTDEVTGGAVEANHAFFVRSAVVTNAATGNRIHAFRTRFEAIEHATANQGRLLTGDVIPFRAAPAASDSAQ